MKNRIGRLTAICICVLCISCTGQVSDIPIIPVDINANDQFSLSEVADEIKAIDLEMTDQSLIGLAGRTLYLKNYIIVTEKIEDKILLFDRTGKFIRTTGSKGQGPGEYLYLKDIAFDEQNLYLYVTDSEKILCYDLNGNCIKERSFKAAPYPEYLCYVNGSLLVIGISFGREKTEEGFFVNRTALYRMDNDLQIIDSLEIKKVYLPKSMGAIAPRNDYITFDGKNTYLYYPALTSTTFVSDTLYRLDSSKLVSYLKARFSDEDATRSARSKVVLNMYKTQRFVFVDYQRNTESFLFCYDSRIAKGYNMKNGFNDDIFHTGKAFIRPLDMAAGTFYYLHTKEDESLKDEPNPTLYIGTFKK